VKAVPREANIAITYTTNISRITRWCNSPSWIVNRICVHLRFTTETLLARKVSWIQYGLYPHAWQLTLLMTPLYDDSWRWRGCLIAASVYLIARTNEHNIVEWKLPITSKSCKFCTREFETSWLWRFVIKFTVSFFYFLPAQHYASAGTIHGPAVSVSLSQVGVLSKRLNELSWFWRGSFLSPILHCVKRKFGISKIKVLIPGTLSQNLDLEYFGLVYRSSKRVIDFAREMWTLRAW